MICKLALGVHQFRKGKTGSNLLTLVLMRARERAILVEWVVEAIHAHGGSARIVEVAEHIWRNHSKELRAAGSLFYTWQYDMRWAAHRLRKLGRLLGEKESPTGIWTVR
jgi:hypothetical protein